ncbi:SLATT domain-containing protein [Streptomyces europaeiscabiei]|uniref:SLATT domain-containing protein n=1 Tax=Streptomyces europaeiscabiei TaxID=146819 RepID=A0AAJ2PU20_9ACTN|nr:DUF4231 domain-containing protein [Streptomyces europaeiscabiei]MDX3133450.1 SLATT domain-containing protein [Streptomyces europaeiscabiei]
MSDTGAGQSNRKKRRGSSGILLPPPLPGGTDPVGVLMHYLDHYEKEYSETRLTAKKRFKFITLWNSFAAALIALMGAIVAVWNSSWLGLVSTALAGSIGVVNSWDGMFRERELWIQRSEMLGRVQLVKRTVQFRIASGQSPQGAAAEGFELMNSVVSRDLEGWLGLRQDQSDVTTATQQPRADGNQGQ